MKMGSERKRRTWQLFAIKLGTRLWELDLGEKKERLSSSSLGRRVSPGTPVLLESILDGLLGDRGMNRTNNELGHLQSSVSRPCGSPYES